MMERELKHSLLSPDDFKGIKELAQSIISYMIKWPQLVNEVQKSAGKEHDKKVEQEARKAFTIVADVLKQVDVVSTDLSTSRAMNELKKEIMSLPFSDLGQFGALKQQINDVQFSMGTNPDSEKYKKFDLLIFIQQLLEFIPGKEKNKFNTFIGNSNPHSIILTNLSSYAIKT